MSYTIDRTITGASFDEVDQRTRGGARQARFLVC